MKLDLYIIYILHLGNTYILALYLLIMAIACNPVPEESKYIERYSDTLNIPSGEVDTLRLYYPDGSKQMVKYFSQGNPMEYIINYYSGSKEKSEGYLAYNKKEKWWKEYHENSQLQSIGQYSDGNEEGYWKYYYENKNLKHEGYYFHGFKSDWWKTYDSGGAILEEGNYTKGKKTGEWRYYQKGKLGNIIKHD